MQEDLGYLEKHEDHCHLDYARFRRRGLPIGSGAVESAIRRVINLRIKGPGVLWEEENAEGMDVPAELGSFKFARQRSKLAGTIRGSYFVIKGEY